MRKVDCEDVQRLIHAFEDNELDVVTSLQLDHHFESCETCRASQSWQRETTRSLQRLREETPVAGAALRQRVHEISAKEAPFPARLRLTWSVAAAFMALLLTAFLFFPSAGLSGKDARLFVETHRMPLGERSEAGIETDDPIFAANWLNERIAGVSAPTRIPDGYRLTGAGIVAIEGERNGVLFYENEVERISCFVFAEKTPVIHGFEEVVVRPDGIRAGHCEHYQVVTWSDASGGLVVVGALADESVLAFAESSRIREGF